MGGCGSIPNESALLIDLEQKKDISFMTTSVEVYFVNSQPLYRGCYANSSHVDGVNNDVYLQHEWGQVPVFTDDGRKSRNI